MNNQELEIFKLAENENAKVLLIFPSLDANGKATENEKGKVITGYLNQEFGFGVGASWGGMGGLTTASQRLSQMYNAATTGINTAKNWLYGQLNDKFGTGLQGESYEQKLFISLLQTVSTYEGTGKPDIHVPLFFLAIKEEDDVRKNVTTLLSGVMPIKDNMMMLSPPLGYKIDIQPKDFKAVSQDTEGVLGTLSLKIGRWLYIRGLVIKSVEPMFSKETTPSGWPLYARVNVTLEPTILWTVKDIEKMFSGLGI